MTNTKHVEPNATQDVQGVGCVGDYISRQAAVEAIESTDWYHINGNGELVSGANSQEHEPLYKASDIYAALEEVPSADVVEVVRCKDCKHRYSAVSNMTIDGNETWCHECLNRIPIRLDLYCAD